MFTLLAVFLQTLALYALYNRSRRALLRSDPFSVWLQRAQGWMPMVAWLMLFASCGILIHVYGFGAGIFAAFVSAMTAVSLIVLLSPVRSNNRP